MVSWIPALLYGRIPFRGFRVFRGGLADSMIRVLRRSSAEDDSSPIAARFNDGRFRVTTEAKLRPLAGFGCSMVSRLISAFIEASRVNETMRLLHFSTPEKSGPGDGCGCGCHAHAQSEHGEPRRYPIHGVSSAGMTSAALHARENASMPPRKRHGRLGPIGKAGISRAVRQPAEAGAPMNRDLRDCCDP
jgi:hypothetical protein